MTDKGIPTILKTDGGPQFASQALSDFCRQWGIHHVLSSPHHHEANGAAEAAVKAMKAPVAKTTTGRIDVDEFRFGLLEFRNKPRAHGFSPAKLLYGRRSQLLTHPTALAEARVARATQRSGQGSDVAHGQGQNPARRTRPAWPPLNPCPRRSRPCATPTHQAVGHDRRGHRTKA